MDKTIEQVQPKAEDQSRFSAEMSGLSLAGLPASTVTSIDVQKAVKDTLKNAAKTRILEEFFLESLEFAAMYDREEEIQAAHQATFDWIFDFHGETLASDKKPSNSKNSFIDWIQGKHASNVYWINGEPGSGKSTLMRYLCDHERTSEQLKIWAGDKPLLRVRYFLWTSGTAEQRSHAGLLRALLHQILQHKKESIPWLFPDMWLTYQDTKIRATATIRWSVELMIPALYNVLRRAADQVKICFFIDGLDELEGNQLAMVEMLQHMVQFSPGDIRACVSSRPWQVFARAFIEVPQLRLQELTRDDISRFVDENLDGVPRVRRILQDKPEEAEGLKNQIVDKADGVFLWAALALKTLVERTNIGVNVSNMLKTLGTLPLELEGLFRYLLFDSRSKDDLEQQSRIFQMIRAREVVCDFIRDESSSSVTLYQLALAEQGENLETDAAVARPTDETILELCQSTKGTLQKICADLLQVHQNDERRSRRGPESERLARSRIGYLHRTVRDFLVYSGGFESVTAQADQSFDPHIDMLRSHVLLLRLPLEEPERHRRLDEWWPDIVLAMTHARYANEATQTTQVKLLNQFNGTLDWYWRSKPSDPLDNWARNSFATYEQRTKYRTPYHYPFLSLSTKFGLCRFLDLELANRRFQYEGGIPLLSYAVEFLADRRKTVYPLSSPSLVEMLLKKGQDPNLEYKNLGNANETPWLLTLKYVREADRRDWIQVNDNHTEEIKRWAAILKLFVAHGADPNALILKDRWDPAATALDVVNQACDKYPSPELKQLLDLLLEHGASLIAANCP